MKELLVRIICFCLALVIALGSVGMAATEQICRLADQSKMPVSCCARQPATQPGAAKLELDKKCCSVSTQHYKLETPAAIKFGAVKIPMLVVASAVTFPVYLSLFNHLPPAANYNYNKPPPLFGTGLLKALHAFRI